MNTHTKSRIELFSTNTNKIKGKFVWQNTLSKRLAALLYAIEDREIDTEAIRESYEIVKHSTSVFSSFRGNSFITIATLLSLHDNQHKQLSDALAVYDMMKSRKFWASDYLVVAAYQVAGNTSKEKYIQVIDRAKAFYDGMKAEHYFLTGQDDYIFAAMLGLSDIEIDSGLRRINQLYTTFKPIFRTGNSVQTLTQVIALGGENGDVESRVLDLNSKFRHWGMRLDRIYTLPSLGVLALLPVDNDTIVNNVIEAYELLREQKGFGRWSLTKQELLLFSSALIAYEYLDDVKGHILTTASTSLTNIIIAQQTAIAVAAATSAAASSSS